MAPPQGCADDQNSCHEVHIYKLKVITSHARRCMHSDQYILVTFVMTELGHMTAQEKNLEFQC